jgi:hypothetical protein
MCKEANDLMSFPKAHWNIFRQWNKLLKMVALATGPPNVSQ